MRGRVPSFGLCASWMSGAVGSAANDNCGAAPLFEYFGVGLPASNFFETLSVRNDRWAFDFNGIDRERRQLFFPGLLERYPETTAIIPARCRPALERHVSTIASGDRLLERLAREMTREGLMTLGDVVVLRPHDLMEFCEGSLLVMDKLVTRLSHFGLGLGSMPVLTSPSDRCRKAL